MPDEMIIEYTRYLQVEKGLAASTRQGYERAVSTFLELCRTRPQTLYLPREWKLTDLDKRALEIYLGHLERNRGWSAASLARNATALRSFFGFLQLRGYVERNPLRSLGPRQPARNAPPPEGGEDAVRRLFIQGSKDLRHTRLQALLELFYGLAMRPGRVYRIERLEAPAKERVVRIHTGEESMELPLSRAGGKRLRAYLAARRKVLGKDNRAPFWIDSRGRAMPAARLSKSVKVAMEAVGLPGGPGLLRQLAARHFLERGGDLRSLKSLLGVKRLGTLDRYDPPRMQDVISAFRRAHPRQRGN